MSDEAKKKNPHDPKSWTRAEIICAEKLGAQDRQELDAISMGFGKRLVRSHEKSYAPFVRKGLVRVKERSKRLIDVTITPKGLRVYAILQAMQEW